MNARPGWYDAGVPGRVRWWDGVQWTAHEREVATGTAGTGAVPQFAPMQAQPQVQVRFAPATQLPHMGWYPVEDTTDVRWWDGVCWTPYRIRDGRPRPDAFSVEPASTGLAFGVLFIALGLMQAGLYSLASESNLGILPVLTLAIGAIWLIGGIHSHRLRTLPVPRTAPVFDPSSRPLPGEVEGADAGWYPVSGQVTRWWTGARWSWYIGQKFGVRPGHAGPRGYRVSMVAGWILAGLGALAVLLSIALIGALGAIGGVAIIIFGVFMMLMSGLVLLLVRARRFVMILPPEAPPLRRA